MPLVPGCDEYVAGVSDYFVSYSLIAYSSTRSERHPDSISRFWFVFTRLSSFSRWFLGVRKDLPCACVDVRSGDVIVVVVAQYRHGFQLLGSVCAFVRGFPVSIRLSL